MLSDKALFLAMLLILVTFNLKESPSCLLVNLLAAKTLLIEFLKTVCLWSLYSHVLFLPRRCDYVVDTNVSKGLLCSAYAVRRNVFALP